MHSVLRSNLPITAGAKSIRIETKTQARASVTLPKTPKTGSAPARIRYTSFTVAVVVFVVVIYSSPGIAEQLSQLCLPCFFVIVVVGFFELLVSYYGNHNSHISDHLLAMRQCTQLNGKTIRKEFCCSSRTVGKSNWCD